MRLTKKARKELREILMDMEEALDRIEYKGSRDAKLEIAIRKMSHFLITY